MSQNVPGSPVLKMCSKHNETVLHTLNVEVSILAVYAKYMAKPTKSKSQMAAKTLEKKQQPAFRWQKTIVSTQNQRKKSLERFFCAASVLAYLQLWQRLRIMDGQC